MSTIEQEFMSRGIVRGGELLLSPQDALDMVSRCRELRVRLLGIDGFRVTPTSTQPLLEESTDFTRSHSIEDTWEEARAFLAQRAASGLLFEVVTEQQ